MDTVKRSQYLHAMGILPWVERDRIGNKSLVANPVILSTNNIMVKKTTNDREQRIAQMDWEALAAEVAQCKACPLYKTRTNPVFGVGNRKADLLVIGEAPGANEDKQGEPFVGRAGQLLNSMLLAIGLSRQQVYIANVVKSRPPENREPLPEEVAACIPFLKRQIVLIKPKLILTVGRVATQYLLNTNEAMGQLRGRNFTYGPLETPVIVTYHPAYLLRSPREKRKAWVDMERVANHLSKL